MFSTNTRESYSGCYATSKISNKKKERKEKYKEEALLLMYVSRQDRKNNLDPVDLIIIRYALSPKGGFACTNWNASRTTQIVRIDS